MQVREKIIRFIEAKVRNEGRVLHLVEVFFRRTVDRIVNCDNKNELQLLVKQLELGTYDLDDGYTTVSQFAEYCIYITEDYICAVEKLFLGKDQALTFGLEDIKVRCERAKNVLVVLKQLKRKYYIL